MISDWKAKKLGDVCTLQRGFDLPKRLREKGDVPLMSSSGCIDNHSEMKVLGPGVVTGRSGSIGSVYYVEESFWPLNTTLYVKNFHGNYPKFIYYLLKNLDLGRFASGAGVPTLNRNHVHSEYIHITSDIAEQQRIVAILDEAFAAIATATANVERNLVNVREVFESYLDGVFENRENEWHESTLGDLITVKHGFAFKSTWFSNSGDYVLLTPGNFYEAGGYRERGDKQKYYIGDIPQDFVLSEGSLLVAMTEQAPGLLGSPLIVPDSNRFLHNQRLGLVEPLARVSWCTEFFFHLFNTKAYRNKIYRDASGVKVRHTSPKKIYNINVRYPKSISSQQEIARQLKSLNSEVLDLSATYEKKLTLLAELKQSILHKTFTGELTADSQAVDGVLAVGGV